MFESALRRVTDLCTQVATSYSEHPLQKTGFIEQPISAHEVTDDCWSPPVLKLATKWCPVDCWHMHCFYLPLLFPLIGCCWLSLCIVSICLCRPMQMFSPSFKRQLKLCSTSSATSQMPADSGEVSVESLTPCKMMLRLLWISLFCSASTLLDSHTHTYILLLGFSTFAILSYVAVSFAEEDPFYYVVSSFPSLAKIGQDHWTLVATRCWHIAQSHSPGLHPESPSCQLH